MIPDKEKKALKKLPALLRGITSKLDDDFYCLICLLEKKIKSHKKLCKNKDFFGILMLSEKNNILKFSQYMKPDKNAIHYRGQNKFFLFDGSFLLLT